MNMNAYFWPISGDASPDVFSILFSAVYLSAVFWALFLGAGHWGAHPVQSRQILKRLRMWVWGLLGLWIAIAGFLILGAPKDLVKEGINQSLMFGIQVATAIVALPAGLWMCGRGRWAPRGIGWASPLLIGAIVAVVSLYAMTMLEARPTREAERLLQMGGGRGVGLLLLVLLAAPVEEVIFRLVLLGKLEEAARRRGWTLFGPIALTALLWTAGHVGVVIPPGLKEAQILLFGLLLGWIRYRYGLRGCILAHLGLNGSAAILSLVPWLATP